MHEVLVNGIGGLSLPRKSVVRLTDRPDMTLDVYRGRKTTIQQQQQQATQYLHVGFALFARASYKKYGFAVKSVSKFSYIFHPSRDMTAK